MIDRSRSRRALVAVATAAIGFGCNLVVGSYEYRDTQEGDESLVDAGDAAPNCNVDLADACYPCAPETNEQFLNSCGESACIPFDRTRLTSLLLPDGGLPPLPSEGGQ